MVPEQVARHRRTFAVLLGVLLLLNPMLVGVLDLGDPDRYRYEATRVASANGTVDVPIEVGRADADVLCLGYPITRSCMLERHVLAEGGVVFDGLPSQVLGETSDLVYAEQNGDDRFYRPMTDRLENGSVRYFLEAYPTDRGLRLVSTPVRGASTEIRTAVESGEVVTNDPLGGAHELIRQNDKYYVVHETSVHEVPGERRSIVVIFQWLVGILGFIVIRQ